MGTAYKIRFLSTSPAYTGKPQSKNLSINPVGTSPSPVNGERCGPGTVPLSATGGSSLLWTGSLSETVPLFMGRKFTTPSLSQTSSYFVQSGASSRAQAGLKTAAGNSLAQSEDGIRFNSFATFRLDSVLLFHDVLSGSSSICEIVLLKDGSELFARNISGSTGATSTKVPLFWRVNPGDGYQIICRNITQGLRTSQGAYPMKVTNLLSMEGPVSAGNTYPYLFDWVIAKYSGCPSRKIEVKARILNGTPPPTPQIEPLADSLFTSVTAPSFEWTLNGQLQQSYNFPKIRALLNSAYQVRYKLDSCWSDWSEPFVVTAQTSAAKQLSDDIRFYPNPSENRIFWPSAAGIRDISLFSPEGKLILHKAVFGEESIDLGSLPDGLYFLHWTSQKQIGTERISLQH
jgi:hypothetical protein